MRAHEPWCASRYRQDGTAPMPCDCGAEIEMAQQLAPFNPLKGGTKRKTKWAGRLPVQFCVRCEGSTVKRVEIVPHDTQQPPRVMAACLNPACAHLRELQQPA